MNIIHKELDSLRTEYTTLQEVNSKNHTAHSVLQISHMTATQELSQVQQANEWLSRQLDRKAAEYSEYRTTKMREMQDLQHTCDVVRSEKGFFEVKCRSLGERLDAAEKRGFELMNQLSGAQEKIISDSQNFKNEITSQKRLIELYQEQVEDLSSRQEEHQEVLQEAQQMLDNMSVKLKASEAVAVKLEQSNQEKSAKIEELEKQLEIVNRNAIENVNGTDLSIISPAAQAANALQKSGKSFTQIYLDYIRVQDENIALKTDIMRLTENLNSVLNDINERAPILKQVNEDRKMLEKEVERLMEDLTESNDSRDKAVVLAKESKERMESLAIRNDSLEKESHDLGRQVQHLLHRLESHQAGVSSRALSPILRKSDPSSTTTSGRLISDRLVLFDNIADLQTQNQQLRGSLRTVSSALKTLEDGVAEKIEERARKEIEEMVGVVDELREELRLTHLKCENYMVERDELRTAATALEGSAGVNSSSVGRVLGVPTPIRGATFSSSIMSRAGTPVAIGSVGGGGKYFDSRMSISSLHDDFDEQRRDSVDEIKRLRELNNTLTRSKNELEIQTARMQIAVENCNERLRNLTDQLEDSKQEAIQLREQITAYMKQQSANESRFNEVSRQLSDSQNALEKISAEERLLREAKEALAVREASLSSENQSLTQRYNTTNDHLIRLQNMFDRVNIDSRENSLRVEEKIKGLEAQLGLVRAQLTASQDESRKNSSRYESNISDCRFQNERLTAELAEAVREREISKFEERRLAQHSADLISRLSAAEKKITELTNTIEKSLSLPESAQLRDTQSQILQVRTELQTTKDALEAQIAHTEQYKAIAESSEAKLAERLEEFNTTYDRFKAEMETKVQEIEAECNVLLARKNEAEERLQQTSRLLEESTIANQQETQEIKRNSVLLAAKVAELESAKKIAEESIQSLHDELSARNGHLTEARQAYERVVGVEAERIRSINLLKEDLKNERQEGLRYKEQMLAIEGESDSNKALWDASKLKFEEEITSLKKTIEELAAQNKIYHNEFEVISGRVSYQTENLETSDAITADEIERGRLELIRILRRDKDALSTECEVSKQSIERLQKQIDQLQLLLNESRSNLENERASKKDSSELESLHKELLSKIDRVNVLTESNSSLRHSNGELKHKNDALEAKLNASEAENRPLKEQNSTLLAEIDAFKSQVIKLETENSKLIGRANQILGKYNPQKPKQRIDPAEHQALKDQVAEAASKLVKADLELAAALNMTEELKRSTEIRIVALNTEITTLQEENKKLKEEAVSSATTWAEREVQLQKMIKDAEAKGKSKVTQANDVIKGKSDIINELNAKMAELKEAQTTLISANAKLLKDVETLNTQKSDIQSSYDSLTTKFHMLSSKLESSTIVGSEKKIEQSAASVSSIATPSSPVPKRPREEEPSVQVAQTATVEVLANIPQNIKQNEPEMKRAKFGLNPEASVFSAPPSTATSVNINLPTKIQKNLNAFASENVPILNPLTEVPIEPAVSAGAVVTAPEGEVIPPTQASTPIPSTQPLGGPKPSIDTTNSATLVNTPYNAVAAIPNNAALSNTPNSAGVAGFSNTPAPGTPVHIRPLRQIVRPSQPISVNQPIMQRVAVRGRGSGAGGNRQISISNSPNGHAPLTQQIQMPRGGGVGRPNHPNTPRPLPAPRQP
ncbi:hypothetical protein HK100_000882 [Physocladia obscura]|uniref:Nucleoprotein TPR/MLP1 domain-containing protein n=1 Tax=Physocladia obscura TaxID=109957 RepID=A0AAD5SXN6_9FUNG|nr:hypothetical protein HK100_000882 [Physocladia obscura]